MKFKMSTKVMGAWLGLALGLGLALAPTLTKVMGAELNPGG